MSHISGSLSVVKSGLRDQRSLTNYRSDKHIKGNQKLAGLMYGDGALFRVLRNNKLGDISNGCNPTFLKAPQRVCTLVNLRPHAVYIHESKFYFRVFTKGAKRLRSNLNRVKLFREFFRHVA